MDFVEFLVGLSRFFCHSLPPLPLFPLFPLLTQCDGCPDDWAWGLMAVLWGLPAMGVCYCLGAGWYSGGPCDFPGTLLPLSLMQLLTWFITTQSWFYKTVNKPRLGIRVRLPFKFFSSLDGTAVGLYSFPVMLRNGLKLVLTGLVSLTH